jgi:peptidoglycan/LPS O-acetylase OafA/YrhL
MLPDDLLHDLSLAATINGVLACCLLTAATLRRNDRLLRIGAGAALATALVGVIAVWPPARWTDFGVVFGVVTGLPALGAGLCLLGYDRHRALAGLGVLVLLVGLVLSIPVFGERFVAP